MWCMTDLLVLQTSKKKNPAKCKTELQPVPNHHTPETNSKFHILNVWKMLLWVWVPGLAPRRLEGKSFQWLPGQQELWKPLDSQGSASGVRSRRPSAGGGGTSPRKKWGTGFRSHTLRKPRSGIVHNWGQASLKSKVGSWVKMFLRRNISKNRGPWLPKKGPDQRLSLGTGFHKHHQLEAEPGNVLT